MNGVVNLLGKPFAENGRGPESYDCWGLACAVYAMQGRYLPEHQQDAFDPPAICHAIAEGSRDPRWQPVAIPERLDLIAIRAYGTDIASHVGVYIDGGLFLHVLRSQAVRFDRLDSPMWIRKIAGFYRYHG